MINGLHSISLAKSLRGLYYEILGDLLSRSKRSEAEFLIIFVEVLLHIYLKSDLCGDSS